MKKTYLLLPFLLLIASTSFAKAENIFSQAWDSVSSYATSFFKKEPVESSSETIDIGANDTIVIKNENEGTISITSWQRPSLLLEIEKNGPKSELEGSSITTKRGNHSITIASKKKEKNKPIKVNLSLIVPEKANLAIENQNGNITIKGVSGTINLVDNKGNIKIENAINFVNAKAVRGSIYLDQDQLPSTASIFLEASKNIEISLPRRTNANLTAKTSEGEITSDIYITLKPITIKLSKKSVTNLLKNIDGTIGTGGSSIHLDSTNGYIKIT